MFAIDCKKVLDFLASIMIGVIANFLTLLILVTMQCINDWPWFARVRGLFFRPAQPTTEPGETQATQPMNNPDVGEFEAEAERIIGSEDPLDMIEDHFAHETFLHFLEQLAQVVRSTQNHRFMRSLFIPAQHLADPLRGQSNPTAASERGNLPASPVEDCKQQSTEHRTAGEDAPKETNASLSDELPPYNEVDPMMGAFDEPMDEVEEDLSVYYANINVLINEENWEENDAIYPASPENAQASVEHEDIEGNAADGQEELEKSEDAEMPPAQPANNVQLEANSEENVDSNTASNAGDNLQAPPSTPNALDE